MKGVIDTDPYALPKGLPVPVDDGACRHLRGMKMPSFSLPSAAAHDVNLATVSKRNAVFFFYPETGKPGALIPDGWNDILELAVVRLNRARSATTIKSSRS